MSQALFSAVTGALIARAGGSCSASLHEAGGKVGALPARLKPIHEEQRLCGRALPVSCPAGDNLVLHHAIYAAKPDDVLVVATDGGREHGYWGDIMAAAAQARGIAGLVITGGVRDKLVMTRMGFPVFCEAIAIKGTGKNPMRRAQIGAPVTIGDVEIRRGDLVFGDADEVVVLPAESAAAVVEAAFERDAKEDEILARLRAGDTTLAIYGLPDLDPERPEPRTRGRRSIELEGQGHGDLPIPAASRVGSLVATGGVRGVDPGTGKVAETLEDQTRLMFDNLRRIIEAAGARVEDIVKVTIWIATPDARSVINTHWLALFPDAHSRPARHVLNYQLAGGMLVQCEAFAMVNER